MTEPRDTAGVIAPPPLIYLGFLLAGWGLSKALGAPDDLGLEPQIRRIAAFVLIVAGLLVEGSAANQFRRAGTRVEPWKPTTALSTDGLYRLSRNPIYVGFTLMYLGFATAMDSWIAVAFLLPCLIVVDRFVVVREERYLASKFGAEYEAYRARVRRWL